MPPGQAGSVQDFEQAVRVGDGGGEAPLGHAVGALALLIGRRGLGFVDVPGEAEDGGDDQDQRWVQLPGEPTSVRPQSNAPAGICPAICLEETGFQTDAVCDPMLRFFHDNSNLICPRAV